MPDNGKVVINLMTGHEDADKVTIAFLVATAALTKDKQVAMFLTKEAVRLGLPGYPTQSSRPAPHPYRDCSSNTATAAASCWCARSASTRGDSTSPPWSPTRASPAPPRCGSGSATTRQSSATSHGPGQRFGRIGGEAEAYDRLVAQAIEEAGKVRMLDLALLGHRPPFELWIARGLNRARRVSEGARGAPRLRPAPARA